ncbi:MAG: lipid-binding SYLF domain-containing protein [Acidobacteria bacterium]|nr:lipid-binding SYLF domain-containing protein [Acidobacteriota bacterium]
MKLRSVTLVCVFVFFTAVAFPQEDRGKVVGRVQEAGNVIDEMMAASDSGIPSSIIDSAKCIAVVPSYLKAAFGIGAQYGRGLASCRTKVGWSAPAFFRLQGGSFGFQIGGQAIDLIVLIMNDHGMQALLSSKFNLGGDASVAAGPVGRQADASTDWKMRAEVLTYSRARGIFAGVSLNGAVINQDGSATRDFYGRIIPFKTLLNGETPAPKDAEPFLAALRKHAGEKSDSKSSGR